MDHSKICVIDDAGCLGENDLRKLGTAPESADLVILSFQNLRAEALPFLQKLRSQGNHAPVIVVSASLDQNRELREIQREVFAVIEWPFTAEELARVGQRAGEHRALLGITEELLKKCAPGSLFSLLVK